MIVVKNTIPSCWNGRRYNIVIIKDNKLFLELKHVNVGNQADFQVNYKVYFAVARNIKFAQSVHMGEMTSEETMFDLSKYPSGLNVHLYKTPGGGRYYFKGSPKAAF